jgi:hypothetical protein
MYTQLIGHTSPETAYVVSNYPWGFRLRTEQRYWIESKTKNGQRLMTQTKNPKNGVWCKAKASTYDEVCILLKQNDNGHVKCTGLSMHSNEAYCNEFSSKYQLDAFQQDKLKYVLSFQKVMKNVTFTFKESHYGPVSLTSNSAEGVAKRQAMQAEQDENKKQQDRVAAQILGAVDAEYRNA